MRVKTFRGFQKHSLVYYTKNGFYYHKMKVMKGGRISLACTLRKRAGSCPGRCSCNPDGTQARVTTPHNHDGDPSYKLQRKLRKAILDRCKSKDPTSYRDIVEQEGQGYSRKVKAANDHITLRSSMRRARLHRFPSKIPETLNELAEVLRKKKYRKLTASQDEKDNVFFGAVGSSRAKTRSLIFMSKRQLKRLRRARKLFADGTWNSRPSKPQSRQVFMISTCTGHRRGFPLAVVLMQSKSKAAYEKLFTTLRDVGCAPLIVHTDFEEAQYSAWKNVFGPQLKVEGCLYHYVVRLRKKATSKKLSLSKLLVNNARADSIVRSCNALPLLPHYRMREGLSTIWLRARRNGLLRRLRPFLQYIKNTWLPRRRIVSVCFSEDRTNNVSESLNHTFNLIVKQRRPNVWLFTDAVVRFEERFAQDLYNLHKGKPVNRWRKTSAVNNDMAITRLTARLTAGDISMSSFLKQASFRMQNVWKPVYGNV